MSSLSEEDVMVLVSSVGLDVSQEPFEGFPVLRLKGKLWAVKGALRTALESLDEIEERELAARR